MTKEDDYYISSSYYLSVKLPWTLWGKITVQDFLDEICRVYLKRFTADYRVNATSLDIDDDYSDMDYEEIGSYFSMMIDRVNNYLTVRNDQDGGKYEHEPQRAHHAHGKEPAHLLHEDLEQKAEGEKAVEEVVNGRKGRSPLQAVLPMSAEASPLFPGGFCLLGFAVFFRLAALFDDVQLCPSDALLLRRTRRPRAAPPSLLRADFSLMLRFSSRKCPEMRQNGCEKFRSSCN